ncbi:hypothetical protein GCM10007862_10970 [Dyella lipolytica]|uniref:Uncharacterized protein n=1 Tax=Dyella lipolytica TaxID=1867835 RepID=A0ABW8IXC8_9GAMM|nr:hypothetical protein [Dyella lipolytica]GLQ46046.1 hypothetical protein GCM10007862_10970 [Dyella lipolytica]
MADDIESKLVWDEVLASKLVGKLMLIGLTHSDAENKHTHQEQIFGRVVSTGRTSGIKLLLEGNRDGEVFDLPPDTRSIQEASPGEYRLRSTGEVVTDPDYTVTYLIQSLKD